MECQLLHYILPLIVKRADKFGLNVNGSVATALITKGADQFVFPAKYFIDYRSYNESSRYIWIEI